MCLLKLLYCYTSLYTNLTIETTTLVDYFSGKFIVPYCCTVVLTPKNKGKIEGAESHRCTAKIKRKQ